MPSTNPVHQQIHTDGYAIITLDRPERRNALNLEIKQLLAEAVEALAGDPRVHALVITGAGGYFVAGTDIAEMRDMTPTEHTALQTGRLFEVVDRCEKPVIAAIEGYALGGGCELALACDIIIASRTARLGQPEINVGIMPGAGGTQRLLRTIGKYRTALLTLTGEPLSAEQAFNAGMLSEVCDEGAALQRACAIAARIAAQPPLAVRAIKALLATGEDAPLHSMLKLERSAFVQLFDSEDQKEGMTAFLEKRKPTYRGH
ncbi:enoyl-CoA hydratase-related protein [Pseudomonas sp. NBRC 111127]|uniref:enoyl-CoA hydratase-related protein n=1 Tax=Pseudomonas sp. NBRC 111127 TaxID=1661042 RepID=UPI0006D3ADED|nr:enoyl-CoA hydratase-related protein [Pseudomonas sp. NBRC 111127]